MYPYIVSFRTFFNPISLPPFRGKTEIAYVPMNAHLVKNMKRGFDSESRIRAAADRMVTAWADTDTGLFINRRNS